MPTGKAVPASRAQIARNGHIAAALRAVAKQRGWHPADFNEAIGQSRNDTRVYGWLSGKGAPGPAARAIVAKATGIPEEQLRPHRPGEPTPVTTAPMLALPGPAGPPPARPVLVFSALEDGSVELELRKTRLPLEEGSALLRLLLDAGIVFRKAQP